MGLEAIHSLQDRDGSAPSAAGHLLLIGANHRTCALEARERLLRRASYAQLRTAAGLQPPWSELVLLTTCNRVEVYALTESPKLASEKIHRALRASENAQALYVLQDHDAAAHLLRVASGLDSIAEGEDQVTEQVRRAPLETSSGSPPAAFLSDLFFHAARIAPRIRETAGLRPEDASASHAAIRFIDAAVPLENPIVALIGTGKMARIAAKRLRGRARIRILNRSLARARQLATTLDGKAIPMASLRDVLVEADVVLAATAVRKPVVTSPTLRAAIRKREGRPLWLIDLGFPRNVDPKCRGLAHVHLVDLDGLSPWGQNHPSPTAHAKVEARIRLEAERMIDSLRPSASIDVASLRRAAEAVRRREVDETLARLPELSPEGRAVVDRLATRLVNRILHAPTQRLRSLPEEKRKEMLEEIVSGLQGGTR